MQLPVTKATTGWSFVERSELVKKKVRRQQVDENLTKCDRLPVQIEITFDVVSDRSELGRVFSATVKRRTDDLLETAGFEIILLLFLYQVDGHGAETGPELDEEMEKVFAMDTGEKFDVALLGSPSESAGSDRDRERGPSSRYGDRDFNRT